MPDIETHLDRVESTFAIQKLPIRYAMAVDGRDIDSWVNLFVADVNRGRYGSGRDALCRFIEPMLTHFYRSQTATKRRSRSSYSPRGTRSRSLAKRIDKLRPESFHLL
jgi:hypothetical protein